MSDLAARLESAWEEAGDRLGIDVELSYVLDSSMGSTVFPVFLPDFGGVEGTVLNAADHGEGDLPRSLAREAGLEYVELHADHARFDAEMFRATLQDLGWVGLPDDEPDWIH